MAASVSENIGKHVTPCELGAFRKFPPCQEYHKGGPGSFTWTFLMTAVKTTPLEGTTDDFTDVPQHEA